MAKADLPQPESMESLPWDSAHTVPSLTTVIKFAMDEAQGAVNWYLTAKRPKQRSARWLRFSAIILAALAGILPMLAQMELFKREAAGIRTPFIEPVWASVLLAVAAALIALDRFFGFSSAWIRYITTALQLRQTLQEFTMDWEAERATWKGAAPTDDQVQKVLARCKAFITQINTIIRNETSLWAAEFQDTLKQLDEAVKAKAASTALASVTVKVTNGEQCDAPGWTLSVDDGAGEKHSGTTAAVTSLQPGMHRLKADGMIGGKVKRAEAVVNLAAGTVGAVEMVLS